MRHIFVIFSGITRLSALATIERLALDPEQVVVVLGRDEQAIDGFECHRMRPLPMRLGRNFIRFRYQLRQFDAWMRELTQGQRVSVYLPGLFSEHLYAMATDPAVDRVNILEEGLGSLMRQTRVYGRRSGGHSLLANLGAFGRFPQNLADCGHFLDQAFHFTPEAFPDWPASSTVKLEWPNLPPPPELGQLAVILSVEAEVESGHLSVATYQERLLVIAKEVRSRFDGTIGVKFHPGVQAGNRQLIGQSLAENLPDVRLLPAGLTLELLMRQDGPAFVGAATSSLHYAAMAGAQAFTYTRMVGSPELDLRFKRLYLALPSTTRSRIEFL